MKTCSFSTSASGLRGKHLTYENVKVTVLLVGRFSVYDAAATAKHAELFTELANDLELEMDTTCAFPWTIVRKRDKPLCPDCRGLGSVEVHKQIDRRNVMVSMVPCKCQGSEP